MSALVVLVGPPGAGKSTVGERLAQRLGRSFRDTDRDVERAAGKPVADIFVEDGEAEFRRLEKEAVRAALADHDGVLALGGGAVLDPDTRNSLRDHRVVLLDVGLADAVQRVGLHRDRPLLLANPRAQLHALLEQRRPLYREVATFVVATDGRPVEDVVTAVEAVLAGG